MHLHQKIWVALQSGVFMCYRDVLIPSIGFGRWQTRNNIHVSPSTLAVTQREAVFDLCCFHWLKQAEKQCCLTAPRASGTVSPSKER